MRNITRLFHFKVSKLKLGIFYAPSLKSQHVLFRWKQGNERLQIFISIFNEEFAIELNKYGWHHFNFSSNALNSFS